MYYYGELRNLNNNKAASNNNYANPSATSLMMMRKIVSRESVDELLFDYLKVVSKQETHKSLLDRMINDERMHFKTIKDIHYQLFGTVLEADSPTFTPPNQFEQGIKDILLRKSKSIDYYVQLMQSLPPAFAPYIYPFIVQEQTHMTLLNFILLDY